MHMQLTKHHADGYAKYTKWCVCVCVHVNVYLFSAPNLHPVVVLGTDYS